MVPVGLAAKCLPSLRLGLCCLPLSPRRMGKKDTCNYVVHTLKVQGGCKTIVTPEKSLLLCRVAYSWILGSVGWWRLGVSVTLLAAGCLLFTFRSFCVSFGEPKKEFAWFAFCRKISEH